MSISKKIKKRAMARDMETHEWAEALMEGFRRAYPNRLGHCLVIQQIPNKQLIGLSTPMTPEEQLHFLYFHIERVAQSQGRKPSEVAFEALMNYGGAAEEALGND